MHDCTGTCMYASEMLASRMHAITVMITSLECHVYALHWAGRRWIYFKNPLHVPRDSGIIIAYFLLWCENWN